MSDHSDRLRELDRRVPTVGAIVEPDDLDGEAERAQEPGGAEPVPPVLAGPARDDDRTRRGGGGSFGGDDRQAPRRVLHEDEPGERKLAGRAEVRRAGLRRRNGAMSGVQGGNGGVPCGFQAS